MNSEAAIGNAYSFLRSPAKYLAKARNTRIRNLAMGMKRWVQSFSAGAEVMDPEDLRQEITADLVNMIGTYTRKVVPL